MVAYTERRQLKGFLFGFYQNLLFTASVNWYQNSPKKGKLLSIGWSFVSGRIGRTRFDFAPTTSDESGLRGASQTGVDQLRTLSDFFIFEAFIEQRVIFEHNNSQFKVPHRT